MSMNQFTLWDIPSRDGRRCWSMNTWKVRTLFAYKGIEYTSEWIEYPEIRPRFEGLVPPNTAPTEVAPYTVPTVQFPDESYVMESTNIALAVEKLYPNPPLRIDIPQEKKFHDLWHQMGFAIAGDFMPKVFNRLLTDESTPFFRASREAMFGMSIEDVATNLGGPGSYKNAAAPLRKLTDLYLESHDGPWLLGHEVSWCDLIWVATLHGYKAIGEDVYNDLMDTLGDDRIIHDNLLKAGAIWLKNNK